MLRSKIANEQFREGTEKNFSQQARGSLKNLKGKHNQLDFEYYLD